MSSDAVATHLCIRQHGSPLTDEGYSRSAQIVNGELHPFLPTIDYDLHLV